MSNLGFGVCLTSGAQLRQEGGKPGGPSAAKKGGGRVEPGGPGGAENRTSGEKNLTCRPSTSSGRHPPGGGQAGKNAGQRGWRRPFLGGAQGCRGEHGGRAWRGPLHPRGGVFFLPYGPRGQGSGGFGGVGASQKPLTSGRVMRGRFGAALWGASVGGDFGSGFWPPHVRDPVSLSKGGQGAGCRFFPRRGAIPPGGPGGAACPGGI